MTKKIPSKKREMLGFILFAIILIVLSLIFKLPNQVLITTVVITIVGLLFLELKHKKPVNAEKE
ncbi:hypothetical protein ACNOIU_15995 (plasmid) [Exiguobacterium mexicanum]|uniref:Uncharacterized protein n=1 Tax=Exiguobacterium mexicanum TaxID=340146 RepID=A0ABT7MTD2_9BACL|nr:hypothetical protein [Exiguobacterium mexicanum]MDL5378430.1 hypothetical protein [Exiguobacterium mexicanum]